MKAEQDLDDYRARLLKGLQVSVRRSTCDPSDVIQVFVNERRVGFLGGREAEDSLQFHGQARVESIQLRSEDGVLLGGLSAPGYGLRTARIPLLKGEIELCIHNTSLSGSARAVFIVMPHRWREVLGAIVRSVQTVIPRPSAAVITPGMRMVVCTQVLLAIIVLGLAAGQITAWMTPERTSRSVTQAEAPWAASLSEVEKLEQQLGDMKRMQATTMDAIQSQQRGVGHLQQVMVKLSSAQETAVAHMQIARKSMGEQQENSDREIERRLNVLMSKRQVDQEQLESKIHGLTAANEQLSKEMAGLAEQNRDLEEKLKLVGREIVKTDVTHQDNLVAERRSDSEPGVPLSSLANAQSTSQTFLFWVNFSEGTTKESIDQWVQDVHGHKGVVNEGWQEVEVVQPPISQERFLEQVRGAKIVKAVRVSR